MPTATNNVIFIGLKGTVLALDRRTGGEVWRSVLKGGDFVNLVIDDGQIYATTKGEVFCLNPISGKVLWNNPMRGMGWGLATIATFDGSTAATAEQKRRDDDAAASTSSTT